MKNKQLNKKEFILCAAINYNGIIICGYRHEDCYKVLKTLVGEFNANNIPKEDNQGFLTSKNRYVGREEAYDIAKRQNQIVYGTQTSEKILIKGLETKKKSKPILISENLY